MGFSALASAALARSLSGRITEAEEKSHEARREAAAKMAEGTLMYGQDAAPALKQAYNPLGNQEGPISKIMSILRSPFAKTPPVSSGPVLTARQQGMMTQGIQGQLTVEEADRKKTAASLEATNAWEMERAKAGSGAVSGYAGKAIGTITKETAENVKQAAMSAFDKVPVAGDILGAGRPEAGTSPEDMLKTFLAQQSAVTKEAATTYAKLKETDPAKYILNMYGMKSSRLGALPLDPKVHAEPLRQVNSIKMTQEKLAILDKAFEGIKNPATFSAELMEALKDLEANTQITTEDKQGIKEFIAAKAEQKQLTEIALNLRRTFKK